MPYIIQGGIPVRVSVSVTPQGAEDHDADVMHSCPECDKDYKTESGLERHLEEKH